MEIGKKIVEKCRGLPLAIKALAGILSKENEKETWVDLLESQLWDLDKERDDIFPVLRLSYDHLPMELKQCFRYLCLFPKGTYLSKSVIIRQWMSHGFIQPKGKKMEEDVGNEYFNEFLLRSILQYDHNGMRSILQYDPIGRFSNYFIMHDVMHDLAQSIAKDEYLLITDLTIYPMIPKTIRHVSVNIMDKFEIIKLEPLLELKHLRTLILSVRGITIVDMVPNLTCLRILILSGWISDRVELWDSIGRMKHLRYLDIRDLQTLGEEFIRLEYSKTHGEEELIRFRSIDASVYNLHYLQTLNLSYLDCETKLSRDVRDLISLRHLYGNYNDHVLREVAELTNLQTLPNINLVVEPDDSEWCKIRVLKRFSDLRGNVRVGGLGNVAWPDVSPPEAYLKDKPGIYKLELEWRNNLEEEEVDERLATQVLDSLQPHRDLRNLRIDSYPGVVLPTWLGHELPALEYLTISGMKRMKSFNVQDNVKTLRVADFATSTEDVESRRLFPSLEVLTIKDMDGLEEWQGAEYRDFPCLRWLVIDNCPKLRSIPSLSHLDRLEIDGCPELRSVPSLPSLTQLFIDGCPELRSLPSLPSLTSISIKEVSSNFIIGNSCLPMLRNLCISGYSGETLIENNDRLETLSIENFGARRSVEGVPSLQRLPIQKKSEQCHGLCSFNPPAPAAASTSTEDVESRRLFPSLIMSWKAANQGCSFD